MKDVVIETDRFLLRSLIESDVDGHYLGWLNGPNKNQYIVYSSQERSIEEIQNYVSQRIDDDSVMFLGIFLRKSGKHIGNIKYEPIDYSNSVATMGILLGESTWRGKGVAGEVIKASAKFLKKTYGIKYINLGVSRNNIAAIRAYEKIGFVVKKMII
jgi:Acetyltransferases, including N-acetylases of ribosomal proteins